MEQPVKVVHVDDVPIERMQKAAGWAISEFRLPISGADGSSTTMFHSIFRAGSAHSQHVHHNCDEFVAYVRGRGVVGGGRGRARAESGLRRRIPQGSQHFFKNQSEEDALVIGFYMGAGSVEGSGYEHRGNVEDADVEPPFQDIEDGTLVTVDTAPVADLSAVPAWSQADVRLSVGSHNGSPNAMLDATVAPGARIERHRLTGAEQLYFVAAGEGVVTSAHGSTPIREGSVVFVAKDADVEISSVGTEPLWFLGVLTGAGGLAEAGAVASEAAR